MTVLEKSDFPSLRFDPNWADSDPENNVYLAVAFSDLGSLEEEEFLDVTTWLRNQVVPVIGIGKCLKNSLPSFIDICVSDAQEMVEIADKIEANPVASATLVNLLKAIENLPMLEALACESMAYATLQGGGEFARWLSSYEQNKVTKRPKKTSSSPILLNRKDQSLEIILNSPTDRNSLSVSMRDALSSAFKLVEVDSEITEVFVSAKGPCFCSGGNLNEFGDAHDLGWAHHTRMLRMPAQYLARNGHKYTFNVHGACIGAGIELSAFAKTLIATPDSFFQLPEVGMGLLPGAGGCVSITKRIGRHRTAHMAISGEPFSAETALQWGLIDIIID